MTSMAVESLRSAMGGLQLTAQETPQTEDVSKPKNLLDLPNEVLAKIIEDTLPYIPDCTVAPVVSLQMGEAPYDFDLALSLGSQPKKEKVKTVWEPCWLPGLRLVCRKMTTIASPVIGRATVLRVADLAMHPESAKLRKCCPDWLAEQIDQITIQDIKQSMWSNPVTAVDVTGFPRLECLQYDAFDVAVMAGFTMYSMKQMGAVESEARALELVPRLQAGLGPKLSKPQLRALCRHPTSQVAVHSELQKWRKATKDPELYVKRLNQIGHHVLRVRCSRMTGLSPDVQLTICFTDVISNKTWPVSYSPPSFWLS